MLNSVTWYRLTKNISAAMTVSPGDKEHRVLAVQFFFLFTWIKAWVAEQALLRLVISHPGLVLRAS